MPEPLRPEHICPRCEGFIPNDDMPGAYPGALSRTDNRTEVCSKCGTDEAMQDFMQNHLTPQKDWPITEWQALTVATTEAVKKLGDFEVEMKAKGVKEEHP